MRKNKLTHLLEPSLRSTLCSCSSSPRCRPLFSVAVAVIEAAVVAVLYLYFRRSNARAEGDHQIHRECHLQHGYGYQGYHGQRPAAHGDLPAGERRGHLSNDRFLQLTGEREHLFDTKITAAVPDFSSAGSWRQD